jgi:hypothetical protein
MRHVPLAAPPEQCALELELQDRDRLLHARQVQRLGGRHFAFHLEARRRIVGVAGVDERLERRERDAVAFLELLDALVA